MVNASNIMIYSAGFYSFFNNHAFGCSNEQNCQERLIQTDYIGNIFLYNLFTYGAEHFICPAGGFPGPVVFNYSNQSGYTSEVAVWLALDNDDGSTDGDGYGGTGGGQGASGIVFIDPYIWTEPAASQTVGCIPRCTLVLPLLTLITPTTITFPPWATSIEIGWTTTAETTINGSSTTTVFYTAVTEQTTLTIRPLTTTLIPVWNTVIPGNVTSTIIYSTSSILPPPITVTADPNPLSQFGVSHTSQTRTMYPPPFPFLTETSSHDSSLPTLTYQSSRPSLTCHSGCDSQCRYWCNPCNPQKPPTQGGCSGSDFCRSNCPAGTTPGGDGSIDPNDPDGGDDDDDDDDNDCTTTTTSEYSTMCIPTTCSTICSTFEGCEVSPTDLATTETPACYWTGSIENWSTSPDDPASDSAVESSVRGVLLSLGLIATTGAYVTSLPTVAPATTTTSGAGSAPTQTQGSPIVKTIYITSTVTRTTIVSAASVAGMMFIDAASIYEVNGKGGARIISNYVLNFIAARSTANVCETGFYSVYGVGTPTPSIWSDFPSSVVSLNGAITTAPMPVSSCIYTVISGSGLLSCRSSIINCVPLSDGPLSCQPEAGMYDTSLLPLIECPYYTGTTTVVTSTSTTVQTITTTLRS